MALRIELHSMPRAICDIDPYEVKLTRRCRWAASIDYLYSIFMYISKLTVMARGPIW